MQKDIVFQLRTEKTRAEKEEKLFVPYRSTSEESGGRDTDECSSTTNERVIFSVVNDFVGDDRFSRQLEREEFVLGQNLSSNRWRNISVLLKKGVHQNEGIPNILPVKATRRT